MTTLNASLHEVTEPRSHIEFGDSGVGGWPADGELELAVGAGKSWLGRMSVTAMGEAERVWAARASARRMTGQEAVGVLWAAVDRDAAF